MADDASDDGQQDRQHDDGSPGLDCAQARLLASARVDGEIGPADGRSLETHLEGCTDCTGWQERAFALRRATMLRPTPAVADLAPTILRNATVPVTGTGDRVRVALGAVSLTMIVRALPVLITGSQPGVDEHVGRHLGAFGVALGVGLAWAAWRPERAIGLVPLAGALALALASGAVADLATGRSGLLEEATHLLELAGLVLVWILSGGPRAIRGGPGGRFRRASSGRSSRGLGPILPRPAR